jgi:glyceraldehyde-3-phosphate dehydrogenase (NADP+)
MSTGDIDILAFIGGSKAADQIIKTHPHPHRLKVFLQLEGKNLGFLFFFVKFSSVFFFFF